MATLLTDALTSNSASSTSKITSVRVGVDIGGTFTDFVIFSPETGETKTFKLLSTPDDPARAILEGLKRISGPIEALIHGSTVATNALLERKGAKTALVTTQGFRDVLEIGRQNRLELYNLIVQPTNPLIPSADRYELNERIDFQGQVVKALEHSELENLTGKLQAGGYQSIAVCFLFSFLQPEHERIVAERLRKAGFFVSVSSEIVPEYREYERTSTTAINAYVTPILALYLERLQTALQASHMPVLSVMQSNGGHISFGEASRAGVRCILSGPAGGIIGARKIGELALSRQSDAAHGDDEPLRLLTFDMGGTSTDVSIIRDDPLVMAEAVVGGLPIRIPVLDIHTIGAGGGSIASIDMGGAIRVGPQSAGAEPGPACYGRSANLTLWPTVTDANLLLGRLPADFFLGGEIVLDESLAQRAYQPLADRLGMSIVEVALGVIEVANAHMERALRVISVERGYDPSGYSLVSFGGAGGLHAAELARRLGIPKVIVPQLASTLSAYGMLASDVVKDYSQTVMLPGDCSPDSLVRIYGPLEARGLDEVEAENIPRASILIERLLDIRYTGQSYELSMSWPAPPDTITDHFHKLHAATYGYSRPGAGIEIVNIRVRASGRGSSPRLKLSESGGPDPSGAFWRWQDSAFQSGKRKTPVYLGHKLVSGNRLDGPALIVYPDTTVLITELDTAWLDPYHNLQITIGRNRIGA
jgi:N-methylhydantoinase A